VGTGITGEPLPDQIFPAMDGKAFGIRPVKTSLRDDEIALTAILPCFICDARQESRRPIMKKIG
jgi:hypothetical protein